MRLNFALIIPIMLSVAVASAWNSGDRTLARRLADPRTRESAVAEVVSLGNRQVPLLLSWTRKPPGGLNFVELAELDISLADVFGQLRTIEAIPFLISHIGMKRNMFFLLPMTEPPGLEKEQAAVGALINIGKPASLAVMSAFWEGKISRYDGTAAICVVADIPDVPEARDFLQVVLAELNQERRMAEAGIHRMENDR